MTDSRRRPVAPPARHAGRRRSTVTDWIEAGAAAAGALCRSISARTVDRRPARTDGAAALARRLRALRACRPRSTGAPIAASRIRRSAGTPAASAIASPPTVLAGHGTLSPGAMLATRFTLADRRTRAMPERSRRVLIVVENLPVPFDRRVWLEATTLARHGDRVSVICPKAKGFTKAHEVIEDVAIFRYRRPVRGLRRCRLRGRVRLVLRRDGAAQPVGSPCSGAGSTCCTPAIRPTRSGCSAGSGSCSARAYIFDHHDLSPEMFAVKFAVARRRCTAACSGWSGRACARPTS